MRILLLLISFISLNVMAQGFPEKIIDDLGIISLKTSKKAAEFRVSLPGYRIGGGTGAARVIVDCLYLDVPLSDTVATLEQKLEIASEINVYDEGSLLEPTVERGRVIYKVLTQLHYVTRFKVESVSGDTFQEAMIRRLATNERNAPVKLIYVRDCRL